MSRSYCLCFELVEDLLSSCLQACSAAGQSIMDVWVQGGRWVARMYRLQVNFWDFLCFQHAPLPCLLVYMAASLPARQMGAKRTRW